MENWVAGFQILILFRLKLLSSCNTYSVTVDMIPDSQSSAMDATTYSGNLASCAVDVDAVYYNQHGVIGDVTY